MTRFDGIWLDSFLTFGMMVDYRAAQPYPHFDRVLDLQREFRRMGLTEIHLEGCGPFGLSTCGYPAELYEYGQRWERHKAAEHAKRIQRIITQYFMAQRVKPVSVEKEEEHKKYLEKLGLLHQMLVSAMKAKQTTDLVHVNRLRSLLARFRTAYFAH